MKLSSYGLSDLGNKRRNNEDRFLRDDRRGIYIVCDGMGGAAAGEVASGNGASMVYSELVEQEQVIESFQQQAEDAALQLSVVLETAIRHANERVYVEGQRNPDRKGMGTTLTALVVGAHAAVVAHVGDSRCYHLHRGRVAMLTEDHTWVADQVRKGKMTPEEAKTSRKQNLIMRALGINREVKVDTLTVAVAAGDRFLLCSDGLHGYFKGDEEAGAILGRKVPLQRVGLECIAIARDRGGKDNVTAIVVEAA
ncbi:MAG: serine/threonine-protein phosphatase [Deltaproteobacteria bacterium]|nr:serine/threonine-protein phosphatase [Deltaproteobacteria bacterium]